MKKLLVIMVLMGGLYANEGHAQDKEQLLAENKNYTGATASEDHYKAVYQLDTDNPDIVKKTFRNINNLLKDTRLKDKLEVELVTFSGGTEVMLKKNPYEEQLKDLIAKGVRVVQCLNSLEERKYTNDQLWDFIGYTPSGNGELIILNKQGWSIVKP
ncbi:hypothetical protein GCM10022216_18930 [Sphingobacterium kyonggiense]|uniref:Intracellular sulfur oxidation DsrE/DsrF family protein n=1 Tax=Sphingobacterium kyonggiense TaxID=714075 RepID=A0ABP7YRA1_9SPHI